MRRRCGSSTPVITNRSATVASTYCHPTACAAGAQLGGRRRSPGRSSGLQSSASGDLARNLLAHGIRQDFAYAVLVALPLGIRPRHPFIARWRIRVPGTRGFHGCPLVVRTSYEELSLRAEHFCSSRPKTLRA